MKKIQLLLICLPILFSCGCNKKKNHLELEGLKGKVKEVTITISNVKESFGDIEITDIKEKIKLRYNEDGYTTEKFKIDKNREVNWEYIYDEDGRWIEMYQSVNGENGYIWKYKHDDDGNHIEADMYEISTVIDYNERFYYKMKSKLDEDGNQIEVNYYNEDGELTQTANFQYDEDGNEIEETISHNRLPTLMTKYRYDEDGNLIAEEKYENGDWDEAFSYESYEFDKENNWIKYITYNQQATPVSITEREIVYY